MPVIPSGMRTSTPPLPDLRPPGEPLKGFDQCRKAIDAAALGVEIDELCCLAGVLADSL